MPCARRSGRLGGRCGPGPGPGTRHPAGHIALLGTRHGDLARVDVLGERGAGRDVGAVGDIDTRIAAAAQDCRVALALMKAREW